MVLLACLYCVSYQEVIKTGFGAQMTFLLFTPAFKFCDGFSFADDVLVTLQNIPKMPYHDKYILQIARRMISFHSAQDMKLL